MFRSKNIEYISIEEMNKHLEFVQNYYTIHYGPKQDKEPFMCRAFIEDNKIAFKLTYKAGYHVRTYITYKDSQERDQTINGMISYRTLQHYYKVPDFSENEKVKNDLGWDEQRNKFIEHATPILYYNKDYQLEYNENCIGYDINSSYSAAMLKKMPDTSKEPRSGFIGKNEIGFYLDRNNNYKAIFEGYSDYIFPLMDSPFTEFINKWYGIKCNPKDKHEKAKAKQMLNFCVGYMQKKNPFLRSAIVTYANNTILNLIDENTLYCNTDSIVSKKERSDIPLGNDLGKFKVEHKGTFKYKEFNYQWNDDKPTWRGISKAWFKDGFDLVKDFMNTPKNGNDYRYEKTKIRLIENTTGV